MIKFVRAKNGSLINVNTIEKIMRGDNGEAVVATQQNAIRVELRLDFDNLMDVLQVEDMLL